MRMIQTNLDHLIERSVEKKERRKQMERVVDYLMVTLRIPPGCELVMVFGTGRERCNRDALITWVGNIQDEVDWDEAETRLSYLARRARLHVIDAMEQS